MLIVLGNFCVHSQPFSTVTLWTAGNNGTNLLIVLQRCTFSLNSWRNFEYNFIAKERVLKKGNYFFLYFSSVESRSLTVFLFAVVSSKTYTTASLRILQNLEGSLSVSRIHYFIQSFLIQAPKVSAKYQSITRASTRR